MILPGTWSPDTKGSPVRHYTEIRGKAVCGERVVVGVEADAIRPRCHRCVHVIRQRNGGVEGVA